MLRFLRPSFISPYTCTYQLKSMESTASCKLSLTASPLRTWPCRTPVPHGMAVSLFSFTSITLLPLPQICFRLFSTSSLVKLWYSTLPLMAGFFPFGILLSLCLYSSLSSTAGPFVASFESQCHPLMSKDLRSSTPPIFTQFTYTYSSCIYGWPVASRFHPCAHTTSILCLVFVQRCLIPLVYTDLSSCTCDLAGSSQYMSLEADGALVRSRSRNLS